MVVKIGFEVDCGIRVDKLWSTLGSSVGRAGDCKCKPAAIPRSVVRVHPGRPFFAELVFGWPSGLRRWFKAPVSSGAWVRIPLRTLLFGAHCNQSTVPISLVGQDIRFSSGRPGFKSRMGNYFCLAPNSKYQSDDLAEWLRRWPAKPLGYAREGSNPSVVAIFYQAQWSRGAMDSAPDFESGGWGFESLRDRFLLYLDTVAEWLRR